MFNFCCFILAGGVAYDFVNAVENYKGDVKSFLKMLWRAAVIACFAAVFSRI